MPIDPVDYSSSGGTPWRKRRALYVCFTLTVAVIVLAGLVEELGGVPIYGVTTQTVSQRTGDLEVEVQFARVTRGQLDSPLEVKVSRPAGFDAQVELRVASDYFDAFTVQSIRPQPSSETLDEQTWTLNFEPPDGNTLAVQWDLTAVPASRFRSEVGWVSLDAANGPTPPLEFTTAVRP